MVLGSSPVARTSPSDFAPASSKEFLNIQATIEGRFTVKRVRDMARTYSIIILIIPPLFCHLKFAILQNEKEKRIFQIKLTILININNFTVKRHVSAQHCYYLKFFKMIIKKVKSRKTVE